MRLRRISTITATAALVAGAGLAVAVATPSIAAVISTAHLADARAASAPRESERPELPTPAPSARYHGPLVAPLGWSDVSRAQLHEFFFPAGVHVRYPENASIAERQEWVVKQCMAERGFLYDPTSTVDDIQRLPMKQRKAFYVAEYGPDTDAAYDWRTAGCHGRAVHLTGQDDAH